MNNGKYNTVEFKKKQADAISRRFGPIETHIKVCECCGVNFTFEGRINSKKFEQSRFCSRNCANSTGGNAKAKKHHPDSKAHYRTVAFRYRDKKCYACGHDRILEAHHIDGNHANNAPDNLIPLCPTHHKMIHSKWKHEVHKLLDSKKYYGK
jgi:pterin-4a-carbinolamine dehydratase